MMYCRAAINVHISSKDLAPIALPLTSAVAAAAAVTQRVEARTALQRSVYPTRPRNTFLLPCSVASGEVQAVLRTLNLIPRTSSFPPVHLDIVFEALFPVSQESGIEVKG